MMKQLLKRKNSRRGENMGFLDKMKNLFTEEIEEEEIKPQKKEIKPVETIIPKRENVVK